MAYVRYDTTNTIVSPQPTSVDVTIFDGTEGWTDITYKDWNGDFVAHAYDNAVGTPGTFQARNYDNTTRTPANYQRHDTSNNPILA